MTAPRFELISQRQKILGLPTEPSGRPASRSGIHENASTVNKIQPLVEFVINLHHDKKIIEGENRVDPL